MQLYTYKTTQPRLHKRSPLSASNAPKNATKTRPKTPLESSLTTPLESPPTTPPNSFFNILQIDVPVSTPLRDLPTLPAPVLYDHLRHLDYRHPRAACSAAKRKRHPPHPHGWTAQHDAARWTAHEQDTVSLFRPRLLEAATALYGAPPLPSTDTRHTSTPHALIHYDPDGMYVRSCDVLCNLARYEPVTTAQEHAALSALHERAASTAAVINWQRVRYEREQHFAQAQEQDYEHAVVALDNATLQARQAVRRARQTLTIDGVEVF